MAEAKSQKETWKNIKNYEGLYQVSNLGRIRSVARIDNRGRHLKSIVRKLNQDKHGYNYIDLHKDGEVSYLKVHRLVAEAFLDNPEGKPQVNHIDGIKTHNFVSNLEWCTGSENVYHAFKTNLKKVSKGEDCVNSKLTQDNVNWIRTHYIPRDKEFGGLALAEKFGVSKQTISAIIKNKNWKVKCNE